MRVFVFCLFFPLTVMATLTTPEILWGKTGHRVVGELASQMISKRTLKKINHLLDGKSLAQVSTFADEIKSDMRYRSYNPWHYANVKTDETYTESEKNKAGDIVFAIQKCVEALKNPLISRADKQFYLMLLVHFVGDLHQPMHFGKPSDRGGNDVKLKWFGRKTNLHRVWDSNMIDDYGMSYTELTANLPKLNATELKQIAQAPLMVWVNESLDLAKQIYSSLPQNKKLGYLYSYHHFKTVRMQLFKGGVRLAALLDDIFK
jgi:hypothetical protein